MPYEVRHVAEHGYLSIAHRGIGTVGEYKSAQAELAELLLFHKLRKLLVDIRAVTNEIAPADHYWIFSHLIDTFPRDTRVAMIINPEVHKDAQFLENVARNNGFDLLCFNSQEEALKWLLSALNDA